MSARIEWQQHAPWLQKLDAAALAGWDLQLNRQKAFTVPNDGTARSVTEWTALLLAEASGMTPTAAATWASRWVSYVQNALQQNTRHLLEFAGWWSVMYATDSLGQTGAAKDAFDFSEIKGTEKFRVACDVLETLAEANHLDVSPDGPLLLTDLTVSCLERDAGVLWRTWLTGCIPAFQPPILTLWAPDPVTARWVVHSFKEDCLSALIRPRMPFAGVVNVGWVSPANTLVTPVLRNQIGEVLRFD